MIVIGIDLAGKDKNPTGVCALGDKSETKALFSDSDIIAEVLRVKPDLVALDAPLSFPASGYYRQCEDLLAQRGFKPLSPMFPYMRILVERGIKLKNEFEKSGIKVIEVYPKASESILGLNKTEHANEHEYEALVCALTGKSYLDGKYEDLSGIIVPKA
ncbi:MAG: DUF429 domain-containing protein [Candidatus Aenigmatarchaeota archaeon]